MFQGNTVNYHSFEYYARLTRVKKYVEQNYAEVISLEKAAQIAAIDKDLLLVLLSRESGNHLHRMVTTVSGDKGHRNHEDPERVHHKHRF